jgi:hypothetical protein
VQPGAPTLLNKDYKLYDPTRLAPTKDDFLGQGAFQHANNTYLALLAAPPIPPGPNVTGLLPPAGGVGTSVTISGSGFGPDSVVDFGIVPSTGVTILSPTRITATAPFGIGIVEVRVTNSFGTSPDVPSGRFSYERT